MQRKGRNACTTRCIDTGRPALTEKERIKRRTKSWKKYNILHPEKRVITRRKAYKKRKTNEKKLPIKKQNELKQKRKINMRYYHQKNRNYGKTMKKWYYKQKELVYNHYGNKCSCCGEKQIFFLSIDHINGNGRKHREKVGKGAKFYHWIVKNNFPKELQILCSNCNTGKHRNKGICPSKKKHKIQKKEGELIRIVHGHR